MLVYRIPSNKRPGAYLIFKLYGASLIDEWRLNKGGAYFKEIHIKCQNFAIYFLKVTKNTTNTLCYVVLYILELLVMVIFSNYG